MSEPLSIEVARRVVQAKAKQFEAALTDNPAGGRIRPVGYEPWMAAVMADFQRDPKLIEAASQAPETVWECLQVAAGVGLIPGTAAGKFYLIPRWNGKQQRMTCTFIIGYKGLAELAYRHPRVHKAEGFVVYEGEDFDYEPGSGRLVHKWNPKVPRTDDKIVYAYSRVVLTVPGGATVDQEPLACVMTIDEIKKIRDRSPAAAKGLSPWTTDFAAMVRKTPMRRHYNGGSVPQSADLIVAVSAENTEEKRLEGEVGEAPAKVATGGLRQALGLQPEQSIDLTDEDREALEAAARKHREAKP